MADSTVTVGKRRDLRAARPTARVPGIERLALPEVRQAIPRLHAYLRECILDGRLPPGRKLSRVALAEQLGVSRTPLREVLRMLQQEGYVEFEPNQRMRVAELDPAGRGVVDRFSCAGNL
jgi:AraC-like DNA-binding protein